MALNPDYDKTFVCTGNSYQGVLIYYSSVSGDPLNHTIVEPRLQYVTSIAGRPIEGQINRPEDLLYVTSMTGTAYSEYSKANWVGWSKIGDITFVQDLMNDSGFKPMSWSGLVYDILKMGREAIVYGSNGITKMTPVSTPCPTFGFQEVLPFGIKNKGAVCGNDVRHLFISKANDLWEISPDGKGKNHGYSEFLGPLVDPVMFMDEINNRVVICDATKGYVFSGYGLGDGYPNITGWQDLLGLELVATPANFIPKPLLAVTDIFDFTYRGLKTIEGIQIGTDTTQNLYVAVDYRYDKAEAFATTPYILVNKEGWAKITITGLEFRIRVKNLTFTPIDLDYILASFKLSDKRYIRGTQEVLKYGN